MEDALTRTRPNRIEVLGLCALVVFGALIRARGFTSHDLWFDDAWAASPARVPFASALHMVLTAPGYGIAQRFWIKLDPTTTWWAQIPDFLLGLAAIPFVWWLVRWFRFSRNYAFAAAVFMAVTPTAVLYSTRVKEYAFDLLMACVLLVVVERIRRNPARRLWPLAVLSVFAVFMSASSAVVVVGLWIATGFVYAGRRSDWTRFGRSAGLAVFGAALIWLAFLRNIPSVLTFNWRRRGYLVDYSNSIELRRTLRKMFGGFAHTSLGFPVPRNFYRSVNESSAYIPALVGFVVVALLILVPLLISWRERRVTVALPAASVLLVAIALAFLDRVPFGDGRTDEVLYPAMIICACSVVSALYSTLTTRSVAIPRTVTSAVAATAVIAALMFGVTHPAKYPEIDLRGLSAQIAPRMQAGDVVVVDTFNSFAWCYYQSSPCRFQIGGDPVWPQGFQPVSQVPVVFISSSYQGQFPDLAPAVKNANRVWYVGFTFGTFDIGTPQWADNDVPTGIHVSLNRLGWHRSTAPGAFTQIRTTNAYTYLLVK